MKKLGHDDRQIFSNVSVCLSVFVATAIENTFKSWDMMTGRYSQTFAPRSIENTFY